MPNNWKTYKLSDALEIKYGKDHKKVQDGTIPIYGTGGIMRYGNQALYDKETILIPRKGSLNNIFYLNEPFWSVDTIFWSKINEEVAFPKYLFYNLKVLDFASMDVGSAIPSLTTELLNKIEIDLPSIEEQQSIASILSTIDDKIENNLAINKTLEEMAMALYKHWFVDFGPFQDGEFVESELGLIPKGWEVKRLDEIADFTNGYAFKSGDLQNENDGNSFHIFKMGHIERGGGLKENATKSYINKLKCEKLEKYVLKVGDLLMAMTDMKDNVAILGNTALINENYKYIVNQRVGLIRPKNQLGIDYSFLYLTTNENQFIERLRSQANSGVQVNLSTDAIKSAKMIIGSKEVNIKFNDLVKPLYRNIFQNKIENQTLTQLRDTLLPKLISGEVRLKEFS